MPDDTERHLIVTHPFSGYARGQRITDAAEIAAVLAANPDKVVTIPAK